MNGAGAAGPQVAVPSQYRYITLVPYNAALTVSMLGLVFGSLPGQAESVFWAFNFITWGISCVWAHRAISNCLALGATGLRFRPWGAFVAMLIPIANLYFGYRIFQEVWVNNFGATKSEPSGLIKIWWRLFVWSFAAGILLGFVGLALTMGAGVPDRSVVQVLNSVGLLLLLVQWSAAGLYIAISWKIGSRFEAGRNRRMTMHV